MAEAPNAATSPVNVPGSAQDSTYFEQVAKLEHGLENLKTETTRGIGQARGNAQYGQGLLSQQEPGTYRTNQARANAGGILESGINARNRGSIATNYANKRFSLFKGLKEKEEGLQRGLSKGEYSEREGLHQQGIAALERSKNALIKESPTEPTAAQTVAAAFPGTPAQKQAAQIAYGKAHSAYVGIPTIRSEKAQPTTGGVRVAAARKVVKGKR